MRSALTTAFIFFLSLSLSAQTTCTTPGQNPGTAFPVCGTSTFVQNSVPLCGGRTIPVPSCSDQLTDINPFWYKFTCFQSGTLGFKITPHANNEDYDWQVFDVTNRSLNLIYTDPTLNVSCNWSGEYGQTGASNAGSQIFVCGGGGKPLWSKMPNIIQGHDYVLLVSHFTPGQSGYDLSFGGGTAVITDSTPPKLEFAESNCGGDIVRVKLNKKMKCTSVAPDGSDFFVTPGNIPITSAAAIGCSTGFDTDSIEVHLGILLPPGIYTLNIKTGSDANTILDYCDNSLPATEKENFAVLPQLPTQMDSVAPLGCKPQSLHVILPKPILCSSVAADGSDFVIGGSYPVTVVSANGGCASGGGTTKDITVNFLRPMYQAGIFTLTLKTGSDGNTILNECSKETPVGSNVLFTVADTVNADFNFQKFYGCAFDTVNYFHPGSNGVTSWQWSLGDNKTSSQQNPQAVYNIFAAKNVQLIAGNGVCSDTSSQTIALDNFLHADFTGFDDNCPNENTKFTSTAVGKIIQHNWSFGDGGTSSDVSPDHIYAGPLTTTPYIVRYTVTDSFGCQSTVQKTIRIYSSCLLAVPTAFTPNGDGLNDYLYPLNAVKADKLDFKVFNRWGQLVFETKNWKQGWDGSLKGVPQSAGVYVWFLSFTDRDSGQSRQMKGTATLIR